MAQPTAMDVHFDQPLQNMSLAFLAENVNWLHTAFPELPVPNKSDKFWVFPRGKMLRPTAKPRSPGSESVGGGFDLLPSGTYRCEDYALHKDIDDQEYSNSDPAIDLRRMTTRYLSKQILLTKEQQFVNSFMQPGVWTNTVAPTVPWDQAGSTPIADLRLALKKVKKSTGGFPANRILFTDDVWTILQDHPDFIARVMFGQPGNPSIVAKELLAAVLGVEQIIVGDAVYNTASETATEAATDSSAGFAYMAPPNVLVCYAAPEPGLEVPSAGYQFIWSGYTGMTGGSRMLSYRIDPRHSERLEIESAFSMGLVSADCGYLLQNVVTVS